MWKDLIPRVKLFIWHAIHDGLATLNEMHRRISTVDPKVPDVVPKMNF